MAQMKLFATLLSIAVFALPAMGQIDVELADKDATTEAKALYKYLKDEVWGKKVLSGCQAEWNYNTNDAEAIKNACGKYPAVNVFDFQHHDQTWINYRSELARNWKQSGGIVSFMWHIHMPCNAFAQHQSDWTGFYTPSAASGGQLPCHISPVKASTEGTLENEMLKTRLNNVASLLLYYQSQDIAILFRPLHEASGGWFWWGSEGAEAYKQLYRYVFNYFTDKGVHNLIWIWTSQLNDKSWYPGDEYVDIIGRDGYPDGNRDHRSQVEDFKNLRAAYPNKMVCMPECNSVPSWANMEADEALWLFVAPWCGGCAFDHNNTEEFWKEQMGSDGIITRDETGLK